MQDFIKKEIKKAVKKLFDNGAGFSVSANDDPRFGHYASNVAMVIDGEVRSRSDLSPSLRSSLRTDLSSPREIAEKIKEELLKSKSIKDNIEKIEIAPPSGVNSPAFLNFWMKDEVLWGEFQGAEVSPGNKKPRIIVVEYGQENIAKPMSVGHLRSNIIGQSLVNIFKFLGENVISDNHIGDWGTQFGKLIVAYKKWGNKKDVEKHPIDELTKLYVRFHKEAELNSDLDDEARAEFKKLEDGDKVNTKLWKWFRGESIKEFEKMYKRLGSKFDYMHGEAFYKDEVRGIIDELLKKKIAAQNEDGSVMVEFPESFSPTPLLVQKSDGATLYSTRDLAAIKFYKKEFKPDLVLQCVGSEQVLYFKQFYEVAERAGWIKNGDFFHVVNGRVRLPEGKMSTRAGKVIHLEKLLDEAEDRAEEILREKGSEISGAERKKLVKILGVGSVIFADLGQNRESNIVFTWDKMLSLDGYSAPYLQYAYARAKAILRKVSGSSTAKATAKPLDGLAVQFSDPTERELAFKLTLFIESVQRASETYHPHIVAQYLFDLAQFFNKFYQAVQVLNAPDEEKKIRLALVQKTATVLKIGLGLLGIEVPERM